MRAERWLKWAGFLGVVTALLMPVLYPLLQLYRRLRARTLHRFYNLGKWSTQAFVQGNLERAEALAREYLELAEQRPPDWNHGNAIHTGNQILGLIRMRQGDVAAAREHLRRAGATPGSPQLNSYGPRMPLARALLEAGEKEVVLEYLSQISHFWCEEKDPRFRDVREFRSLLRENRRRLARWKRQVRSGHVPADPLWRRLGEGSSADELRVWWVRTSPPST